MGVALWMGPLFWQPMPWVADVPVLIWLGVSTGRINTVRPVWLMFPAAFSEDWGWLLVWRYAEVFGIRVSPDYLSWWTYWLPAVLLIGSGTVAHGWWWQVRRPAAVPVKPQRSCFQAALRAMLFLLASCAVFFGLVHFALLRLPVSDFTLDVANEFLVPARCGRDFEFLVRSALCRGKRLGSLLDQVELDWRRKLWEAFYPQVRHASEPDRAARIVVRVLRERVGVSPDYPYRVGVETIWTQGMTDEAGFERVYVAALRSVGIAARLGGGKQVEFFLPAGSGSLHRAPCVESCRTQAPLTFGRLRLAGDAAPGSRVVAAPADCRQSMSRLNNSG